MAEVLSFPKSKTEVPANRARVSPAPNRTLIGVRLKTLRGIGIGIRARLNSVSLRIPALALVLLLTAVIGSPVSAQSPESGLYQCDCDEHLWYFDGEEKHWIADAETFADRGFTWLDVVTLERVAMKSLKTGAAYHVGDLVRDPATDDVFLLSEGKRRLVRGPRAVEYFGLQLDQAVELSTADIQAIPSGDDLVAPIPGLSRAPGQSADFHGWFSVLWGDPEPGTGGTGTIDYFITDDDGETIRLLPSARLGTPRGALIANARKRVRVTGVWGTQASSATARAGARPALELDSIEVSLEPVAPGNGRDPQAGQPLASTSALGLTGSQPYVNILCRFAGNSSTPYDTLYVEGLMSSTSPGLNDYWPEVSYGNINIAGSIVVGWYDLPQPLSYYQQDWLSDGIYRLLADCAAAADADVYFPSFSGINLYFNSNPDLFAGRGGSRYLNLDGQERWYGTTWIYPRSNPSSFILAHEMGHTFGLPHSSGPYNATYDSGWDVMSGGSNWACRGQGHPIYGGTPFHTISHHKDRLGWIPDSRKFTAAAGTQTITISRLALPPAGGYLMAQIPIGGSSTHFYTLETRMNAGYDNRLCGEGVIIHEVDTTRGRPARVIDVDNNGDPNDDAAVWTAGEMFNDSANGISVKVLSGDSTGINVRIDVGVALGDAPVTSWLSPSDLTANRGTFYTFTAGFFDGASATDLHYAELLINNNFDPSGACYVRYDQNSNDMQIHNGTSWLSAGLPGSGATVSGPICDLDAGGSSATPSGNSLVVAFSIRFGVSAWGSLNAFLQAIDYGGLSSGGNDHGDLTISAWNVNARLDWEYVYAEGLPPGVQVSFQIFDSPGGTSLYGPVTRNASSGGRSYLYSNDHGLDLVPGLYVVATDLSTGFARQLEIAGLYIDSVDELNDLVSGRAPPSSPLETSVSGFWDWDAVAATSDSGGSWQADYGVRGVDITGGAYVSANVSDVDGDKTHNSARTSNIVVSLSEDSIRANDITVGGSLRFQIFESSGGTSLYGPVTQVASWTYYTLDRSEHGVDLVAGNYVVVTDLTTGTVRDLVLADLSIISVDVVKDTVSGTAPPGETVGVWLRLPSSGTGASTSAMSNGSWLLDVSSWFDITSGMTAEAEVANLGGNETTVSATATTGVVGSVSVDLLYDSVSASGFTADSSITIQIFASPGGASFYGPATFTTDSSGWYYLGRWVHGLDLIPGQYVVVTDVLSGGSTNLVLASLYIDSVNTSTDVVSGRAPAGAVVDLTTCPQFGGFCGFDSVTAGSGGTWSADFGAQGHDVTSGTWLYASTPDADGDRTRTAKPPTTVWAAPAFDSVSARGFTPNGSVMFQILASEGGPSLYGPVTRTADYTGWYYLGRSEHGLDLVPGNSVLATDLATGLSKELIVAPLHIGGVDPTTDVVSGRAEPGSQVYVVACALKCSSMTVVAAGDGTWSADFSTGAALPLEGVTAESLKEDGALLIERRPVPPSAEGAAAQPVDIVPGSYAYAHVPDGDADVTHHSRNTDEPPTTVSVSPNNATVTAGTQQVFAAKYADGNGWADLKSVYLLVNDSYTSVGACYVAYGHNSNSLWLHDGTTWLSAGSPGSGSAVSGPRCDLDPSGSSVSGSGTGHNLTVNFAVTFKTTFAGTYNLFLRAVDDSSLWSSATDHGSLTVQVPNAAPTTTSITPASGTIASAVQRVFAAVYSELRTDLQGGVRRVAKPVPVREGRRRPHFGLERSWEPNGDSRRGSHNNLDHAGQRHGVFGHAAGVRGGVLGRQRLRRHQHVFLLVNSAVSASGACYVHYNEDTNRLAVRSGSSWKFTSTGPGSGSPVSSAQCSLDPSASSVSRSGDNLTVNYAITFRGAMA